MAARTTLRLALGTASLVGALAAGACAPVPPPAEPAPAFTSSVRPPGVARPSAGCALSAQPSSGRHELAFDSAGGRRRWLLDVPFNAGPQPAPLLVSLHPFLLTPEVWDAYSGLAEAGTARGYVVVTPLGSDPGPRWAVPGGLPIGPDDLQFLSDLLDRTAADLCIDTSRVFAAGFSAGAAMAMALGCTMPDRIRAVVASGGANLTSLCPDAAPEDTLILHGTADPIAPPGGSELIFAPPIGLSVDAVAAATAQRAGCSPSPTVEAFGSSVLRRRFQKCRPGTRVEYWQLLGAGHTWAGTADLLGAIVGPTTTEISATRSALDFFDTAT